MYCEGEGLDGEKRIRGAEGCVLLTGSGRATPRRVEMPESECADPETKKWLLSKLTPLAHFGFKDPPQERVFR